MITSGCRSGGMRGYARMGTVAAGRSGWMEMSVPGLERLGWFISTGMATRPGGLMWFSRFRIGAVGGLDRCRQTTAMLYWR